MNLIADFPPGNVFADGFNGAGALKTWVGACTFRGRVSAFPLKGIGSVKGGGVDSDKDFAVAEVGVFHVLELQHLGASRCGYHYSLHFSNFVCHGHDSFPSYANTFVDPHSNVCI